MTRHVVNSDGFAIGATNCKFATRVLDSDGKAEGIGHARKVEVTQAVPRSSGIADGLLWKGVEASLHLVRSETSNGCNSVQQAPLGAQAGLLAIEVSAGIYGIGPLLVKDQFGRNTVKAPQWNA